MTVRAHFVFLLTLGLSPGPVLAQSPSDLLNMIIRKGAGGAIIPQAPRSSYAPAPQRADDAGLAEIQSLLNARGFNAGTPDGVFGPATLQAIMAFQRSLGQQPTGTPTDDQLIALRGGGVPESQEAVDIREVQQGLADQGYDIGVVDGLWGARSQVGLDAFRAKMAVERTGRPTAEDVALLRQKPGADEPAAPEPAVESAVAEPDSQVDTAPGFETADAGGHKLVALPFVDAGRAFRVGWETGGGGIHGFAVVAEGTTPAIGDTAWKLANASPVEMTAPEAAGPYDIVWLDPASGAVVLRRPLEVR